ncbi:hypothetical protein JCM5350_003119 [Sporobolomyces pararoseus]
MLSFATTLLALPLLTTAHMSPWLPSMYGVGPNFEYSAGNPVDPIGPGWTTFDDWWFRGPSYRALKPQSNVASQLPAGGSFTMEIACHVAWTSYGYATTEPGSPLDACPGDNAGPYHAGDPNSMEIDDHLVSGCALAIADVENIEDVTMDNLVVFSTNQNCVRQKETTFEIPAKMPKCTGSNCICSWQWLAANGTANFYQTGFNCTITGADPTATPIAPPSDPVFCGDDSSKCTKGAKRPIYAYNYPSNVQWEGFNDNRPGYHGSWSFPNNGAQNDIFLAAGQVVNSTARTSTNSTANPYFGTPTGAGGAPDLALSVSTVTASSTAFGQGPWHAVDGWTGGYKEDQTGNVEQEWSSNGEKVGAWLNLVWNTPVTFNQIVLFDRPNLGDQVTAANITFSDGSFVSVGTLNNDGSATYFNLASPVTTSSLRFTVTGVSSSTGNVGLSEIELFSVPASGFSTTTPVQGIPKVVSSAAVSSTISSSAVVPSSSVVVRNATSSSVLASSTLVSSSSIPVSVSASASSALPSSTLANSSIVASSTPSSASSVLSSTSSRVSSASSVSSTGSSVAPIQAIPISASSASASSASASKLLSSTGSTSSTLSSSQSSAKASSTSSSVAPAAPTSSNLVDLARQATATASSFTTWTGQTPSGAIDGIIGGYLLGGSYYTTQEWASGGEKAGAWLQLKWVLPQSFNQIVLWDRPNTADQVLAGNITFADGTGVSFGQLPNDAKTGLTINLAQTVTSNTMKIYISQVSSTTKNTGFSEVQVYAADASKFASGSLLSPTRAAAAVVSAASSSIVVPSSASSSKVSSTSSSPLVWSIVPTNVIPNPKNAAPTSSTTSSSPAAVTTTTTPAKTSTTAAATTTSLQAWTRVSQAARAILALPARKRDSFENESSSFSNGSTTSTRHVRDFRLTAETK